MKEVLSWRYIGRHIVCYFDYSCISSYVCRCVCTYGVRGCYNLPVEYVDFVLSMFEVALF